MKHRGFTLVELLVVIAIILVLLAIALPVLLKARGKALQTTCLSNLAQLGKAAKMWAIDNNSHSPRWPDEIAPYVGNRKLWVCPLDPDTPSPLPQTGPIYTSYIFRRTFGVARDREPWHHGGFNVLYHDGRVKWQAAR